jgi:NADPH2:quinone reductase
MRAIHVTAHGGPEVMDLVETEPPEPGPGEVAVDVEAVGVNFADIKRRRGSSSRAHDLPFVPGIEAAGTVRSVGEGAAFEVGDRVAVFPTRGSYAEVVVADADRVFPVPASVGFEAAAAFPVQFLTAHESLHACGDLEAGDDVLVHAAAGGLGYAAVQLAAARGATVFGTASTAEKRRFAERLGADHTIDYESTDFRETVEAHTEEGVDLVLDGVGGETFDRSLDAVRPFGRVVTLGSAGGTDATPDTGRLRSESAHVVGYHLSRAVDRFPGRVHRAAAEVFGLHDAGGLEFVVGERFDLAEAGAAHAHVEGRESHGKVVLVP